MPRRLLVPLVLVALLPPTAAGAQEGGSPDRWDLEAEISYTDQTGNKVLRLLTGGIQLSHRENEAVELEALLRSRYGESEGEVVARNHFGSLSVDLQPRQRWSPFLFVTAERDPFKRLDVRLAGGAGAKYTVFPGAEVGDDLSVSLALLYFHEDLRPTAEHPEAPRRSLARWSLRVRAARELRPGITVQHVTFYQPVWDWMADYLLRSETGARVLLTERLALAVSYQLDRTARPPAGVQPDDRLLKTGLIIDF